MHRAACVCVFPANALFDLINKQLFVCAAVSNEVELMDPLLQIRCLNFHQPAAAASCHHGNPDQLQAFWQ